MLSVWKTTRVFGTLARKKKWGVGMTEVYKITDNIEKMAREIIFFPLLKILQSGMIQKSYLEDLEQYFFTP